MGKCKTPEKRDSQELERAVKALQASAHNPVDWTALVRFLAPIIARIASRYAMRLVARRLNKRISSKIREETVIQTADHLAEIALKRTSVVRKK